MKYENEKNEEEEPFNHWLMAFSLLVIICLVMLRLSNIPGPFIWIF